MMNRWVDALQIALEENTMLVSDTASCQKRQMALLAML